MKLRLNLAKKDLGDRFGISQSTVPSTFKSWIRVLAKVLQNLIHVPDQGSLNFTAPKRFKT